MNLMNSPMKKKKQNILEEMERRNNEMKKKLDESETNLDKLLERLRGKHPEHA